MIMPLGFMLAGCGHNHDASYDWQSDATHHWHTCLADKCDDKLDYAEHTFNKKVYEAKYLDQPATASTKATYFYSCECGAKGTQTFEKEKVQTQLTLWQDMDKVYDGLPVQQPACTINRGDLMYITPYYKLATQPDSAYTTTAPTDAGDYVLRMVHRETDYYASSYAEKEFTISKLAIESASISKEYDGLATVSQQLSEGVLAGDEVILTVGMSSKNVGATKVNDSNFALSGAQGNNYTINYEDVTAEIYQAQLVVTYNKVYDNKAQFTINLDQSNTTGLADCDTELTAKILLFSSNAGENQNVNTCTLSGTGAENYILDRGYVIVNVEKLVVKQVTFELTYWGSDEGAEYFNSLTGALAGTSKLINFKLPSKNVGTYSTKDANPVEITGYGIGKNELMTNYVIEELVVVVKQKTLHGKQFEAMYEADGIYSVKLSPFQNNQIEDDVYLNFDATNITEANYNRGLGIYSVDIGTDYCVVFIGLTGEDKDNYYFEYDQDNTYPNASFYIKTTTE